MAIIDTDIATAVDLLGQSQLVAIPTETVYGLAGNAMNAAAVSEIFRVKERPSFDPLIVHTHSIDRISEFTNGMPLAALELAQALWPGPLTLILPRKDNIPYLTTSGLETVGVRIPDHSLTLELLSELEFPLAAPSANPFGYISPTQPEHVNEQLGQKIPYILDGGVCRVGIESTIVGFENDIPVIYRMGGIEVEKIIEIVGEVNVEKTSSSNPKSPGMLKSHYAPLKKVIIGSIERMIHDYKTEEISIIAFSEEVEQVPSSQQFVLSRSGDLSEAAQNLFKALRTLDKNNTSVILAELVPDKGLGRAINDRLIRASTTH